MVPKTAEEIAEGHAAEKALIADVRWNPSLGWGLGVGALCGIAVYFITLEILPWVYKNITVIR
jgi:AAT family amino acid transporter